LPPTGITTPYPWKPRNDEANNLFTETARISSRDEDRHLFRYGVFTSAANAALETAMELIRSNTSIPDEKAYAYALIDAVVAASLMKAKCRHKSVLFCLSMMSL
jgi:hypothetical protein